METFHHEKHHFIFLSLSENVGQEVSFERLDLYQYIFEGVCIRIDRGNPYSPSQTMP